MILYSLASVFSVIFVLCWSIYHFRKRKERFNIFHETMKAALEDKGEYKGRKVIFGISRVFFDKYIPFIVLPLKKEHKDGLEKRVLKVIKYQVIIEDDFVGYTFREWSNEINKDNIIKILDKLSSVAGSLESRK